MVHEIIYLYAGESSEEQMSAKGSISQVKSMRQDSAKSQYMLTLVLLVLKWFCTLSYAYSWS